MGDERLDRAAIDALFRFAPLGLALVDAEKRYVRVNERLAALNGVPADQHLGRRPRDVIPEVGDAVEGVLEHVLETKLPLIGLEMDPPTAGSGANRGKARVNIYPVLDGERAIGVLGVVVQDDAG